MRLVALGALACFLLAPGAVARPAGGSLWAYVSLPDSGRLALVDAASGTVAATLRIPRGAGAVAASVDGSRILVIAGRAVIQLDGLRRTTVRTFTGLGDPVAVAMAFDARFGLVRPRYAYVLDAAPPRLDVLDLFAGVVVARVPLAARPFRLVSTPTEVWIAHRGGRLLTVVDVSAPARPAIVARVDAGAPVGAIAVDAQSLSAFVTYRASGELAKFRDLTFSHELVYRRRIGRRLGLLGFDYGDWLWVTDGARAMAVAERDCRVLERVPLPAAPVAVATTAGWIGFAGGHSLTVLQHPGFRRTFQLPGRPGGVAFAVLP